MLLENLFIIFVCIMNQIPLFLISESGTSKHLAFNLIKDRLSLNYKDKFGFFKNFPKLFIKNYVGHINSQNLKIIEIFNEAKTL